VNGLSPAGRGNTLGSDRNVNRDLPYMVRFFATLQSLQDSHLSIVVQAREAVISDIGVAKSAALLIYIWKIGLNKQADIAGHNK
jgi:hypothetical protein